MNKIPFHCDTPLRKHAQQIIEHALSSVLPDEAVRRALSTRTFSGRILLVAAGKAAWQMAKAAHDCLGDQIENGVVVTKYDHVMGNIANFKCFEAGHPVPDENSFRGTQAAIDLVGNTAEGDTVIFLLSGGGSALFEVPLVSGEVLQNITNQLLSCGADIVEINTIRKRLSKVKGGRFAQLCAPAQVFSVVLSDVLGDPLDMIASGPACADRSTCEQAIHIAKKYNLTLPDEVWTLLTYETPKQLDNVESVITGSVSQLCKATAEACQQLGYQPIILTNKLNCEAREAGSFLSAIAATHSKTQTPFAFIAGGETVVHLTGNGKGGRNQELALAAAPGISGSSNILLFSVGSDGTDGPTDAAGGIVDGRTSDILSSQGIQIYQELQNNNAYVALEKSNGLIMTGPTGTNVNDVSVLLILPEQQV